MIRVHIKNTEPAWVEYGFTITLPDECDGLPDNELRNEAMERLNGEASEITYGPEVQGQIDGMDQEWDVTEIERDAQPTPPAESTDLRTAGRREFARELHAMLFPEEHPPGDPNHNPDHVYWQDSDPNGAFQWSAETIEWVADAINEELK